VTTRVAFAVWTLALLCAAAAIVLIATSDHTNRELATILLAVPTGLAFVASGIIASSQRPRNRTGLLLTITGFSWFLGALTGANNSYLFTAGLVLGSLFIGLLAHLLLAFPTGQLATRTDRVLAAAFYVVVIVGPPLIYAFDEGEISDMACDGPCPENELAVVGSQTVANVIGIVYLLSFVVLVLLVLARLALRWRRASPALRRALGPVFATAGVLIALAVVQTLIGFFSEDAARAINFVVLGALLAVPLSFLYGLLRSRLGATTRRLVAELSEKRSPEEVRVVLRRALRDPTLEIGYVTTGQPGYVDVDGRPLRMPTEGSGRALTPLGEEVLVHDASLETQPELGQVLDAAHIALERGLSLRSLEASERRHGALLDAIPDNVYRVAADGTFLDALAKGSIAYPEEIMYPGIPTASVIGRRVQDVMPAISDVVIDGIQRALTSDEGATVELELDTPIGTRFMESRFVRSGEDEVVGIVRDVTDRRRQEQELRVLAEEQAALRRVAVAVATEQRPEAVFDVVTEDVARLLGADGANLVRFDSKAGDAVIVGKWSERGVPIPGAGERVPLDGGALTQVRRTGRPARMKTEEPGIPPELRSRLRMLGVTSVVVGPIAVSGELWGAVAVSLTGDREFELDAEERIGKFAGLLGVALANAAAREELAMLAEEQAALSRVAVAVATEERPELLFSTVSEEIGRLFGARAAVVRYIDEADEGVLVGGWEPTGRFPVELGVRLPFQGGAITRVRRTGRTTRIDIENEPPDLREHMVAAEVASTVAAPIVVSGRLWGATSISVAGPLSPHSPVSHASADRFPPDTEERLEKFTRLVAVAIANAEAREQLTASRARIVEAGDAERQRLERNLHDGAQQRLVTLSLSLRIAQSTLPDDPARAHEMLEASSDELALALEELRELARGLHPAILSDRGLPDALAALAARAPVDVELGDVCAERLPPPVEAAAYYVVAESLTNVAKYADASSAQVSVKRRDGFAIVEVSDDGIGGADATQGSGLRGLADRVEALRGRLVVTSETGRGTRVRAEIPYV
jgi:signal transduction histidine kinase/PAS domain-containing protein